MGESGAIHLARATAYRDLQLLDKAEQEYVATLKYAPDDLKLHLALADTQFHERRYPAAVQTLNAALRISPDDPEIYAQLAARTPNCITASRRCVTSARRRNKVRTLRPSCSIPAPRC